MPDPVVYLREANIYQGQNLILSDVAIEVFQGEFIYLIGKTGSGKSSLMKTLYADLPLEEGLGYAVGFYLDRLKKSHIPHLRRKMGIVFQDFKLLLDRTIYENLEFVLRAIGWKNKEEIQKQIEDVLDKVGMKSKISKMPLQVSEGEQQRIAIARALLNDPDLILADEPTGNLDPITGFEVMQLLHEINKNGKTVIMATHDYSLLMKFPSKILKCENNTVSEVVRK